jgi:magnesium transporter
LEDLETELMENPETDALHKLHLARKEALKIRRSVYPLREVVGHLAKVEPPLLSENLDIFLRDLYDHAVRVIETSEIFRDAASGLLDLYMNSVSNRMNEIMKVLTIIATIFIPLTFIAGIYGMNFEFMPELSWRYGYFVVWGVMLLVLLGMVIYFKRKKWF